MRKNIEEDKDVPDYVGIIEDFCHKTNTATPNEAFLITGNDKTGITEVFAMSGCFIDLSITSNKVAVNDLISDLKNADQ